MAVMVTDMVASWVSPPLDVYLMVKLAVPLRPWGWLLLSSCKCSAFW